MHQPSVMRFHRSVTIARYLLKRLQICDLDDAPLILDHTGPLEGARCDVHAVAPPAQHLSQVSRVSDRRPYRIVVILGRCHAFSF
jgi:hypothetical protein